MGFITEIVYLSIVLICFIYLIIIIQNSKTEWELIDLDESKYPLLSIIHTCYRRIEHIHLLCKFLDLVLDVC